MKLYVLGMGMGLIGGITLGFAIGMITCEIIHDFFESIGG
jgi:hypothetical protein